MLGDKINFTNYGVDLYGIDIASKLLDIARTKGNYKSLQQASFGDTLPFPNSYFDIVIANGVLGYCATNRPLYEFLRILKSGGFILITIALFH